jgi:NTE family protein
MAGHGKLRQYYNGWHAAFSALAGRPTIFKHRWPGLWSALPGSPDDVAIFDHDPLRATLCRLVDFERVNTSGIRLSVGCVDLASGEEVFFDTRRDRISADHLMASTAITPLFEPVEIDGRALCDAGYVNNTPVDVAFAEPPTCSTLCIVIEPFCLAAPLPKSLDAALERSQDLMFASPTRKSIEALQREYALRARHGEPAPPIVILHVAYRSGPDELAVKALDFSPASIRDRWEAGNRDAHAAIERLAQANVEPGLQYIRVRAEAQA